MISVVTSTAAELTCTFGGVVEEDLTASAAGSLAECQNGILGLHDDLLCRCATPQGVSSTAGALSYPLYHGSNAKSEGILDALVKAPASWWAKLQSETAGAL